LNRPPNLSSIINSPPVFEHCTLQLHAFQWEIGNVTHSFLYTWITSTSEERNGSE
jgi:hypothetical protein